MKQLILVVLFCMAPASAMPGAQVPKQPAAQEGFVPVDQLPNQEQLPATPLVAAAYGVAWAAVLIYVWMLWRRLARVERELADVSKKLGTGGR